MKSMASVWSLKKNPQKQILMRLPGLWVLHLLLHLLCQMVCLVGECHRKTTLFATQPWLRVVLVWHMVPTEQHLMWFQQPKPLFLHFENCPWTLLVNMWPGPSQAWQQTQQQWPAVCHLQLPRNRH